MQIAWLPKRTGRLASEQRAGREVFVVRTVEDVEAHFTRA